MLSPAESAISPRRPVTEARDRLAHQLRSGLSWSMANVISARVLSFASGIVLARILAPRDFGLFTLALVVTDALMSLNDVGLISALVRLPGEVKRPARTALTMVITMSVLLYAAVFAAAPVVASAVHSPDAAGLIRLLAIAVLIDGVSSVPSGLLTRKFRQDIRAAADVTGLFFTIGVSVLLAWRGMGPWSLAWGRLAGNAVGAVILISLAPYHRVPGFDLTDARDILKVGLPLAGASLLNFAVLNVDYLVVGAVLGPVSLGFYMLAFNLSSWPVGVISQTVRKVSLIGFSRLRGDPESLSAGFGRSLVILLGLTLPICVLLAVLAQPLIRFIYGPRWEPAVTSLRYLAVMGAVRVLFYLVEDLLAAAGRSPSVLILHAIWFAALLPALLFGAHADGIRGVAIAQAVVALGLLPVSLIAVSRAGVHFAGLASRLRPLLLAGLGAGFAALVLIRVLPDDFIRIAGVGLATTAIYCLVLLAAAPNLRVMLIRGRPIVEA